MGEDRALILASVIAVSDTTFYYAYCEVCYCKISPVQGRKDSFKCRKCGSYYAPNEVNYRYRLHLSVSDRGFNSDVTIFGRCLEPIFGISASGLQRMMVKISDDDNNDVSPVELLYTAVKRCLVGSVYLFGFKCNHQSAQRTASQRHFHSPVRLEAIVKHERAGTTGSNGFPDKIAVIAYQMVRLDGKVDDANATVLECLRRLLDATGHPTMSGANECTSKSVDASGRNLANNTTVNDGESGYLTKDSITMARTNISNLSASRQSEASFCSLWGQSSQACDDSLECKLSCETTSLSSKDRGEHVEKQMGNLGRHGKPTAAGLWTNFDMTDQVTDNEGELVSEFDLDMDVDHCVPGDCSDTGIGDVSCDCDTDDDSYMILQNHRQTHTLLASDVGITDNFDFGPAEGADVMDCHDENNKETGGPELQFPQNLALASTSASVTGTDELSQPTDDSIQRLWQCEQSIHLEDLPYSENLSAFLAKVEQTQQNEQSRPDSVDIKNPISDTICNRASECIQTGNANTPSLSEVASSEREKDTMQLDSEKVAEQLGCGEDLSESLEQLRFSLMEKTSLELLPSDNQQNSTGTNHDEQNSQLHRDDQHLCSETLCEKSAVANGLENVTHQICDHIDEDHSKNNIENGHHTSTYSDVVSVPVCNASVDETGFSFGDDLPYSEDLDLFLQKVENEYHQPAGKNGEGNKDLTVKRHEGSLTKNSHGEEQVEAEACGFMTVEVKQTEHDETENKYGAEKPLQADLDSDDDKENLNSGVHCSLTELAHSRNGNHENKITASEWRNAMKARNCALSPVVSVRDSAADTRRERQNESKIQNASRVLTMKRYHPCSTPLCRPRVSRGGKSSRRKIVQFAENLNVVESVSGIDAKIQQYIPDSQLLDAGQLRSCVKMTDRSCHGDGGKQDGSCLQSSLTESLWGDLEKSDFDEMEGTLDLFSQGSNSGFSCSDILMKESDYSTGRAKHSKFAFECTGTPDLFSDSIIPPSTRNRKRTVPLFRPTSSTPNTLHTSGKMCSFNETPDLFSRSSGSLFGDSNIIPCTQSVRRTRHRRSVLFAAHFESNQTACSPDLFGSTQPLSKCSEKSQFSVSGGDMFYIQSEELFSPDNSCDVSLERPPSKEFGVCKKLFARH